jgi:hypothetical protein
MSYEVAVQYAERLGSDLVDLGRAGHVNIASGYGRWKRGYRLAARFDRHHYHDAREPKVGFFDTIMGYGAKGSRQLD